MTQSSTESATATPTEDLARLADAIEKARDAYLDAFANQAPYLTDRQYDDHIERAAATLAKLLPSAITTDFDGEPCTAAWPFDFGPQEQVAFRLITRAVLSAAVSAPAAKLVTNGEHP